MEVRGYSKRDPCGVRLMAFADVSSDDVGIKKDTHNTWKGSCKRGGKKKKKDEGTQKDTHINGLGRTIWGVWVEPFAMQTLGMLSKAVRKAHSGEREYSLRAKRKYS